MDYFHKERRESEITPSFSPLYYLQLFSPGQRFYPCLGFWRHRSRPIFFRIHQLHRPSCPRIPRPELQWVVFYYSSFKINRDSGIKSPVGASYNVHRIHTVLLTRVTRLFRSSGFFGLFPVPDILSYQRDYYPWKLEKKYHCKDHRNPDNTMRYSFDRFF